MKNRQLASGIFLLLAFTFFPVAAGAADLNLAGTYECKGTGDNNSTYSGTTTITQNGDVYVVSWLIDETNQKYTGTGIVVGNVLAVSYHGDFSGVIAYKIDDTTTNLTGKWTAKGQRSVFKEKLKKMSP